MEIGIAIGKFDSRPGGDRNNVRNELFVILPDLGARGREPARSGQVNERHHDISCLGKCLDPRPDRSPAVRGGRGRSTFAGGEPHQSLQMSSENSCLSRVERRSYDHGQGNQRHEDARDNAYTRLSGGVPSGLV